MKKCLAGIFGGITEKVIDGRVDVMARGFCVEIEPIGLDMLSTSFRRQLAEEVS